MKHIFRVFTLLFLFTAVSNLTKADEKTNVVKQGTLRGPGQYKIHDYVIGQSDQVKLHSI